MAFVVAVAVAAVAVVVVAVAAAVAFAMALDIPRSRKYVFSQLLDMLRFRATFLVSHFMQNMYLGGDGANTNLRLTSNEPVMHILRKSFVGKSL